MLGSGASRRAKTEPQSPSERKEVPMKQSTNNKVRWGVIGCGGIAARRTLPEFVKMASSAEIDSVMDVDPARAADVAARFNVPHHCTSEADCLPGISRRSTLPLRKTAIAGKLCRPPKPASISSARSRWQFP